MPQEGLPAGGGPGEDAAAFDWWAAPGQRVVRQAEAVLATVETPEQAQPEAEARTGPATAATAGPEVEARPDTTAGPEAEAEVVAEVVAEPVVDGGAVGRPEPAPEVRWEPEPAAESAAAVYRHVQAGEEFQEIRREYRSFVFPACAAFLAWYLLYIVTAVTLPRVMDHPVAGPFNVAWALGLLQFASTFLITWLYARHARDRRDRTALGLRWETQDRLR